MPRPFVPLVLAALCIGCGELTTRTWVTIEEKESGGFVEFGRLGDAYEAKYGRRPRNENVTEADPLQLTAR